METVPTEVIEVVTQCEYVEQLDRLIEYGTYITGFLLFLVIVVLCYFSYKFLRIFF